MTAVWLRARSQMRTRRVSAVALALILGLGAGSALGAAAAARRSSSAYPRFLDAYRGADLAVANFGGPDSGRLDPGVVAAADGVEGIQRFHWAPLNVPAAQGGFVQGIAFEHDIATAPVDRAKIVVGRAADPTRADEAVLPLTGAAKGLRLGMTFGLATFPGDELAPLRKAFEAKPGRIRIVGVAAMPGNFPPQVAETSFGLYLTPAFFRAYPNAWVAPDSFLVRLRRGVSVEAFRSAIQRDSTGAPAQIFDRHGQDANVQRSILLQAAAMWIVAGLIALITMLIGAQAISRRAAMDSDDDSIVAALGMTGAQRAASSALGGTAIGAAGALVAVVVALVVSKFMPIGLARTAEPRPGFSADGFVLGLGAVASIAFCTAVAAATAWRERRTDKRAARASLASRLARMGLGAPGVVGMRLALERGRGRTSVPVASTIAGIAIGILSIVATTIFASSMERLRSTPRYYGVSWDRAIGLGDRGWKDPHDVEKLGNVPGVSAFAIGNLSLDLLVNDRPVRGIALTSYRGTIAPPIFEGRMPIGAGEILLGTRTLRSLRLGIGDHVAVRPDGTEARLDMVIVGRGVIPTGSETTELGEGALIPTEAFAKIGVLLGIEEFSPGNAFIRVEPTVGRAEIERRLAAALAPGTAFGETVYEEPVATPADISSFGGVSALPEVLEGLLTVLAALTLANTLITAIRRRRRDLSIVKALGFVRRQTRGAVAWQSTTIAVVACLVAIPGGVIAGRWMWELFARQLGVVPDPNIETTPILIVGLGSIALANLIALLPARSAARTHPAIALRTE